MVQAIARSEALWLVAERATAADAQRALREAAPDLLLIDISTSEFGVETVLGIDKIAPVASSWCSRHSMMW